MLKELFFHIWRDDVGSGWILFTIISFNFCLAFLTFVFCRAKAKNIKFSKKHSIYLIICALIMYQIIPLVLDFYASALYLYKYTQKAIKFEKLAIKTAIIPWQKGCYYLRLSDIYLLDHDYKNELNAQNKAYSYLKTYQAPCWGSKFLIYYTLGKYDIAIEMATDFEKRTKKSFAGFISNCYLMKRDFKKSDFYRDKELQQYPNNPLVLAKKAYIQKLMGNTIEAQKFYNKSIKACKKKKERELVDKIYKDYIGYEKTRIASNKYTIELNKLGD